MFLAQNPRILNLAHNIFEQETPFDDLEKQLDDLLLAYTPSKKSEEIEKRLRYLSYLCLVCLQKKSTQIPFINFYSNLEDIVLLFKKLHEEKITIKSELFELASHKNIPRKIRTELDKFLSQKYPDIHQKFIEENKSGESLSILDLLKTYPFQFLQVLVLSYLVLLIPYILYQFLSKLSESNAFENKRAEAPVKPSIGNNLSCCLFFRK